MAIERRLRALVALIAGLAVISAAVAGAAAQEESETNQRSEGPAPAESGYLDERGAGPDSGTPDKRGEIDASDFDSVAVSDVIHVKFTDEIEIDDTGQAVAAAEMDENTVAVLESPGVTVEPLFDEAVESADGSTLDSWARVTVADASEAESVHARLNESDAVEAALFEPHVAPASIALQASPDFEPNQLYRDPAPVGVDADFAAGVPGGDGAGIVITDLEYSWNTNHEDLLDGSVVRIPNGVPQDPFDDTDHGTAVLGVVTGDVNGFGVTGVAPEASIQLVNTFTASGQKVTNALGLALANSSPGDVVLIEQQLCPVPIVAGSCAPGWLPMEWFPSYYDVIVAAVQQGIHVVQAAGNGSRDLDSQLVFPDSGAILVGAGAAPGCIAFGPEPTNGRLDFSNYGERVDLQSHGGCVWTTGSEGGGTNPDDDKSYTGSFTGTSSASAVVAGVVASVAGVAEANGDRLAPNEMRALLRQTGSPQNTTADARPIGPQPDLRAAISSYLLDPHPGPANDDLGSPTSLTVPGRVSQQTTGASVQVGEPLSSCGFADETIWYELTPTETAEIIVSARSGLGSPSIALWAPTGPGGFTQRACTAAQTTGGESRLSTRVSAGERYLIQVGDGRGGLVDTIVALQADCDLNADGAGDLLVGVPGESIRGRSEAGAINLYYGHPRGERPTAPLISQAGPSVAGVAQPGDEFGFAVSCADFNGDGFDDAAVGVPGEDRNGMSDVGQVHVFWGSAAGISGERERVLTQALALVPGNPQRGDRFGESLASGDVNGDGYADLVVGVPGEGWGGRQAAGIVQVVMGGAGGFRNAVSIHQNTSGVPGKAESGDRFGESLLVGDLDLDGFDDLILAAPREGIAGVGGRGMVAVVPGGPGGPAPQRSVLVRPAGSPSSALGFGSALAIGDLNRDGRPDLAVASPGKAGAATPSRRHGRVHIIEGSLSGPGATASSWVDARDGGGVRTDGDRFGAALVVTDRDSDGRAELYIGAPGASSGGDPARPRAGAIARVTYDDGFQNVIGEWYTRDGSAVPGLARAGDLWGSTMLARDLDGDLSIDLAVAAPGAGSIGRAESGVVVVLTGGSGSGSSASSHLVHQGQKHVKGSREPSDGFGAALG